MAIITIKDNGATPLTPPAGYVRLYPEGTTWKSIDSSGNIFTFSNGLTAEEVQDIVGALLVDSSTINVTYNDGGDIISADVIPGAVNHDALLNFVANEHVDHSLVSIIAGTGLTGGGDLTAPRTLNLSNVGTAGTYRSVTTDAQGRVTAGTNPTTLAGYGITDAQPLDGDLTAVAALAGTGLVTRTATNTMTTRTVVAGTGVSVANGDGVSGNPTVAISNTGVTANTYGSASQVPQVAINAQGQATSVSNVNIAIPLSQITQSSAISGQVPQWNGSVWVATTPAGASTNVSSAIGSAQLNTTISVGNFQWRYSTNATGGNLQIISLSGTRIINWNAVLFTASAFGGSGASRTSITTGSWVTLSAGGTLLNNYKADYFVTDTVNADVYRVRILNDNDTTIFLSVGLV